MRGRKKSMHTSSESMYEVPPVVGYLEKFERHCSKSYESNMPEEAPVVVYTGERLEPYAKGSVRSEKLGWDDLASPAVIFASQDVYSTMSKQVKRIGMLLGSTQPARR